MSAGLIADVSAYHPVCKTIWNEVALPPCLAAGKALSLTSSGQAGDQPIRSGG